MDKIVPFPSSGSLKHTPSKSSTSVGKSTSIRKSSITTKPIANQAVVNISGLIIFTTEAEMVIRVIIVAQVTFNFRILTKCSSK